MTTSKPNVQGEPLAYISHTSEGDILGWERQFDAPSHTALFTAPQVAKLAEALESLMDYVPYDVVQCRGDKCRELWCASCFGEEDAEAHIVTAAKHLKNAKSALAAYHKQQETNHDISYR